MKTTSFINGWLELLHRHESRFRVILILGCLAGLGACASSEPPPVAPPVEDEQALLELLEYLLEFETEDGEWIDPQQVLD